jgi:hypothetical protein
MSDNEQALEQEIIALVRQVESAPEEVADLAADIAEQWRHQHDALWGLLNVNAMVEGTGEVDLQHPSLVALRMDVRDRLRNLLRWARESGRM